MKRTFQNEGGVGERNLACDDRWKLGKIGMLSVNKGHKI